MILTMPRRCILIGHSAIEQELLEVLMRKENSITIAGIFRSTTEALGFLQKQCVDMALADRDALQRSDVMLLQELLSVMIWSCSSWHSPIAEFSEAGTTNIFLRKPLRPHSLHRALAEAVDHLETRSGIIKPSAVAEASVMQPTLR